MEKKVIAFGKKKHTTYKANQDDLRGFNFSDEVDKDIEKLMKATGLTREESINLAKDFYRRYPMLMEFVRSPNELLRR